MYYVVKGNSEIVIENIEDFDLRNAIHNGYKIYDSNKNLCDLTKEEKPIEKKIERKKKIEKTEKND